MEPRKKGALPMVARATGSDLWDGAVSLGALWASLPGLPASPNFAEDNPSALRLVRSLFSDAPIGGSLSSSLSAMAGLQLGRRFDSREEEIEAVGAVLEAYPTAMGWGPASGFVSTGQGGPPPIWLTWRSESESGSGFQAVESIAEEWNGSLYLRPGLGENQAVPSQLVTWWGILLALSSIARYQPVLWRAALDIDASPTANALEEGLHRASQRLPDLILSALESA